MRLSANCLLTALLRIPVSCFLVLRSGVSFLTKKSLILPSIEDDVLGRDAGEDGNDGNSPTSTSSAEVGMAVEVDGDDVAVDVDGVDKSAEEVDDDGMAEEMDDVGADEEVSNAGVDAGVEADNVGGDEFVGRRETAATRSS